MVPVRSRDAAFTSPRQEKLDPVTMAHWIVSDLVRSARIAANAPLPELYYPALHAIVPATFGKGPTRCAPLGGEALRARPGAPRKQAC